MRPMLLLLAWMGTVGAPVAQESANPDPTVRYFLPFPPGFSANIFQGNDQGPTHNTAWARYAFDFSPLAEGSAVHAAATGPVVYVKEDSSEPTGRPNDNNEIAIQHADRNVSTYHHLMRNGALVQVGDVALRGDLIGWSGNTGNSTQPHLCFSLRRGHRVRGLSEPVRFIDVEEDGVPKTGETVRSANRPLRPQVGEAGAVIRLARLVAVLGLRGEFEPRVQKALAGSRRRPADAGLAAEIDAVMAMAQNAWADAAAHAAPGQLSRGERRVLAKAVEGEWRLRVGSAGLTEPEVRRLRPRYRAAIDKVADEAIQRALREHVAFLEGYLPDAGSDKDE